MRRIVPALLILVVLGGALVPAVWAQDAGPALTEAQIDHEAFRLHQKFMSPFCPGKNLRDCTSSQAAVWRDQIRDWVAEGHDEKWIEDQLIEEFGEQILSAPRFKGFNSLVWLFPGFAILVGLAIVFSFLQRQHGLTLDTHVPGSNVPDDYRPDPKLEARLERELDQRAR